MLEPSETVIVEFESFAFAIEPANILFSTEPAAIVAVKVVFPKLVIVALPVKSPPRVITGSETSKSNLPFVSSYVTAIPLSLLPPIIAPTTSSIASW